MTTEDAPKQRLKFYGLSDYGTYWQLEQVVNILEQYDASATRTITDVIELHNVQLFAERDLFPQETTDSQRATYKMRARELRQVVGRFFNGINEGNVATVIEDVGFQYHDDLLQLLVQYKAYERCTAATLLAALEQAHIWLHDILTSKRLVQACDQELGARLLSDPRNAEHIIRHHLERESRREIHLPATLTAADKHTLINAYLDADDANPNSVELVAKARVLASAGINAKTKLKAQRKHAAWTKEFFEKNSGIETGCEVSISAEQVEPVEASLDGLILKLSYSSRWLEENLDFPTILNNFLYVFEFTNRHMVLTLPSYHAQLGVFERVMTTTGRDAYQVGSSFDRHESLSLLQTAIYSNFLRSKNIDLESVVAWFFSDYLKEEFGAENFRFAPSSTGSTYLEKCKHLFSEMEGVAKQFTLYVEEGEIDTGLLTVGYEQLRYRAIPSLLSGKYVYVTQDQTANNVLQLLFSDQSGLAYVDESLQADSAASLFIDNEVAYERLADHQKRDVDYLIRHGLMKIDGQRVTIADVGRFGVLRDLFDFEAASYYHYSAKTRAGIDRMVDAGWVERRASLLSEPEANYFNYCLNAEYSNGPELRNRYLHGTYDSTDGEDEHSRVYFTALKLLIALIIKINDDFWLRDAEATGRRE
jgi:hypothetical protein